MTRWFRVRRADVRTAVGLEFEVNEEATQEEVDRAAYEAVAEYLDFGFEEIDGPNGKAVGE